MNAVLVGRTPWLVLLGAGLLATVLHVAPARAGANRCETSSQPTAVDQGGAWYQSPDGDMFGEGGVDGDDQSAQLDFWSNHSVQAYRARAAGA